MKERQSIDDTSLNRQAFGLIIGLCLQYVLGITTTLFVELPDNVSEEKLWEFAWRQVPLALHIILGLFLLLGGASLLVSSIKLKSQKWINASIIGLALLLLTALSGSLFVDKKSDIYSFIMAVGFIITLFTYIWGIFSSKTTFSHPLLSSSK